MLRNNHFTLTILFLWLWEAKILIDIGILLIAQSKLHVTELIQQVCDFSVDFWTYDTIFLVALGIFLGKTCFHLYW